MLTDRQQIALTFLANTISNEADLVFLARGSEKVFDFAFKCADRFLEKAKSYDDNNSTPLIDQLQTNNQKLKQIIETLDSQYLESASGD